MARGGTRKNAGSKRGGEKLTQICEIVESIGPASVRQITPRLCDVSLANPSHRCRAAVKYGLMTVDKSVFPPIYTLVNNWRDILEDLNPVPETVPYYRAATNRVLE